METPGNEFVSQDEVILQQQRQIEKEFFEFSAAVQSYYPKNSFLKVAASHPLIADVEPLSNLLQEYKDDSVFKMKIEKLCNSYKSMRRVRPDGNCFFRGFGFRFFERLLKEQEECQKFQGWVKESKDQLLAQGFPKFTLEDFHDSFMDAVNNLGGESKMKHEELLELFNDAGTSDYLVVYLRLITSGQLQRDEEFYKNFIEGGKTVKEFCQQEVEPMYRESDHMHAIALGSALNVGIRVVYLDRGESSPPAHDFPENCIPQVTLLYRPGHYDILYN